ncbi:hypothetical protein OHB00_05325 [Streptomyces sp. NBC_00631]|uniref:hypothetical protein n=1 Tax=Streptomyces sp. NBC_00631 TaxID=2975793 RepID=UPI0030E061F1
MPQDVTFDLPFQTPVGEHPEFARVRRPRRLLDMDLAHGEAASAGRAEVAREPVAAPPRPAGSSRWSWIRRPC